MIRHIDWKSIYRVWSVTEVSCKICNGTMGDHLYSFVAARMKGGGDREAEEEEEEES